MVLRRPRSPGEWGTVRFLISSRGTTGETVLENARQVLSIVNENSADWPDLSRWQELLPRWFVASCAPEVNAETSRSEVQAALALPWEERARPSDAPWRLSAWLAWLEPSERLWTWWAAMSLDAPRAVVAVECYEWPFP